jgi:thiamine pyrophosphate-dependent acetolactate synthase large subunit-like protein
MPEDSERALNALKSGERRLVIVGKGMAWSRAAAMVHPDKPIIHVSGDSAIGCRG